MNIIPTTSSVSSTDLNDGLPIISLMPEDNQQENFVPRFWLIRFFIWILGGRMKKRRAIKLQYNAYRGLLEITFRTKKGYLFYDRRRAEKWFGGKIDVSPHLGEKVVTVTRGLFQQFDCPDCEHSFQSPEPIKVKALGPRSIFLREINLPAPSTGGQCPCCEKWIDMTFTTKKLERRPKEKEA